MQPWLWLWRWQNLKRYTYCYVSEKLVWNVSKYLFKLFPHTQPFRTDCNPILKVKSLQPKLTASSLIFKGKRSVLLFSVGQGFIWWIWLFFTCTLLSGRFIFMATSSLMKMSGYFVLANSSSKTSNWDFVKVVRSLRCFRGGPVKKQKKINTAIEKLKFLGFASFSFFLFIMCTLQRWFTAKMSVLNFWNWEQVLI